MKPIWMSVLLLVLTCSMAHAEIVAKEMEYSAAGKLMKGYLAYDDSVKGKRPGVLVVHEWWGHNDYARKRAKMLAELGYTAFALDMYGEGKQAHHPKDANQFSSDLMKDQATAQARFNAALSLLRKDKTVDRARVAAIGYCFGGAVVLQMARNGSDLSGAVSFHGNLSTASPASPGAIKGKILVLTGADDPFIPPEQVDQFKQEMDAAKADYRVVSYPGAKHSFTNPEADRFGKEFDLPLGYNKNADEASWKEMLNLFHAIFK